MANLGLELCRRLRVKVIATVSEGTIPAIRMSVRSPSEHAAHRALSRVYEGRGASRAWPAARSDEVLDVPLGHDRRLSRSGTGVESNVAVKIQTKALAVVELDHQKSPPEWSETAQECAMLQ